MTVTLWTRTAPHLTKPIYHPFKTVKGEALSAARKTEANHR